MNNNYIGDGGGFVSITAWATTLHRTCSSHHSINVLLGGTPLYRTSVSFRQTWQTLSRWFIQLHSPSAATSPWPRPHLPAQKSIHISYSS